MSKTISHIKINGGKSIYGTVDLMGDSVNSIALIVKALMYGTTSDISNVPRTTTVFDFLKLLASFGVSISWTSVTSVHVSLEKTISSDLTHLSGDIYIDFIKLLIPLVLKKRGICKVPNTVKPEIIFYKNRGFDVKTNRSYTTIVYDRDRVDLSNPIDFAKLTSQFDISSRFLILNLIGFNENELRYVVNTTNILDSWYSNLLFSDFSNSENMRSRSSRSEFSLFTTISLLTRGEIVLSNFDLAEMLSFLLLIEKFGGRYIVTKNRLKIWSEDVELETYYDFKHLDNDYSAFALIIALMLSRKSDHVIHISLRKTDAILSLIRLLNILGFDLLARESSGNNVLIIIKPIRLLMKLKISLNDVLYAEPMLALTVALSGKHVLMNVESMLKFMPGLLDVLSNLGADISYR